MQDFDAGDGAYDGLVADTLADTVGGTFAPALPRDATSPCVNCDVRTRAVCAVLNDEELASLARFSRTMTCDAGETLFFEGDETADCFIVKRGALKLYKLMHDGRRQIIGFLFQGDFLGFGPSSEYQYTAEALEPVETCSLRTERMRELVSVYPKLSNRLLNLASLELATAQEQMLLLGRKSAQERVASFLLWLSRRAADRHVTAHLVQVPMSRADMGDYLGLTMETVSRAMTKLKTTGVIGLKPGNRVQIKDMDMLVAIASGDA